MTGYVKGYVLGQSPNKFRVTETTSHRAYILRDFDL